MKAGASTDEPVPPEFVCPLTKQLMNDPMMSRYGHRFERQAILDWIGAGHTFCPVSNKPLRYSSLISDKNTAWKIAQWKHSHGVGPAPETAGASERINAAPDASSAPQGFISITPRRFLCPLTSDIMHDPVMTKTGINYERKAILDHLNRFGDVCPVTKKPLRPSNIVANCKLQWEIRHWNESYGSETELPVGTTVTKPTAELPPPIYVPPKSDRESESFAVPAAASVPVSALAHDSEPVSDSARADPVAASQPKAEAKPNNPTKLRIAPSRKIFQKLSFGHKFKSTQSSISTANIVFSSGSRSVVGSHRPRTSSTVSTAPSSSPKDLASVLDEVFNTLDLHSQTTPTNG